MSLQWVVIVIQLLACTPVLVTADAGLVFNKPQIRLTTTFINFNARIMDHWGNGGGKWAKIPSGSGHPFQGRTFGGAKRSEIRGTRAFGSGYPYSAGNQSMIARRHFPFGVWPLYWDQNFMGADEYGSQYDTIRPGGFIASVPLRTTNEHFNVTDDEVYYAVADRESLLPLMISYVTACHVTPAWPSRFNASAANPTVKLENVIQYFRASSFALASPAYNNTLARTSISDTKESTPLPEFMEYSPFRKCLDGATESSLAIVNTIPGPTPLEKFYTALAIGGWALIPIWLFLLWLAFMGLALLKKQLWIMIRGDPQAISQARANRETEIRYENYP